MNSDLFGPRAIGRHVFVLVLVGGCITGGVWQIARLHQREQYNALVKARERFAPAKLSSLIPSGGGGSTRPLLYRRVSVEGTYDQGGEVVLFGRELDNTNGNDVLTPLRMADGRYVVVDRGWVPFNLQRPPVKPAVPPAGAVTVTGVLYPPDVQGSSRPQPRVPGMTRIDLGRIGRQFGHPVLPVYVWLQGQTPSQPGALPEEVPLPILGNGPHLSYAVQWFLFATVGIVGYPIFLRREMRRPQERVSEGAIAGR